MSSNSYLADFQMIRPRHEISQESALEWIVKAHAKAQKESFSESTLRKELLRVGCKPSVISNRGIEISDLLHESWEKMEVYQLEHSPQGISLQKRQELHSKITEELFQRFYEKSTQAPDALIHVSCTGYTSPSAAQKLVSSKNWGEKTEVTHAYHMGCYASIPAIRMAYGQNKHTDIVHTELSSLHFNPCLTASDQLIAQTLFADGFMKYSIQCDGGLFKILGIYEQLLPSCSEAMTWQIKDWGFQLSLMKEIPLLIAQNMPKYIRRLCEKAEVDEQEILQNGIFAIHPGGPKILEYVQKMTGIKPEQYRQSREVLKIMEICHQRLCRISGRPFRLTTQFHQRRKL